MQDKTPYNFGFYGILTEPLRGYAYVTEVLVANEISFVQLRIKDASVDSIFPVALEMRRITQGTKTKLIINDNPNLAASVGADGVHIGQSDMAYKSARKIVGEKAIIGISTHSIKQAHDACTLSPDYIGTGPVFPTPTKKNPDPVIGIEIMKQMHGVSTVSAIAIGGITLQNLPDVLAAGARNFCMVRPINQSENPEKVLKDILKVYRDFK